MGTATATVAGRRTITVALNATGRRLLRGHRRLAVTLTATQAGTALGAARTVSVRGAPAGRRLVPAAPAAP